MPIPLAIFWLNSKFNVLVHNIFGWSQHFTHITTVTLLWCVQNFIMISWAYFKPEHCKIRSNCKFDQNIVRGMVTWSTLFLQMAYHQSARPSANTVMTVFIDFIIIISLIGNQMTIQNISIKLTKNLRHKPCHAADTMMMVINDLISYRLTHCGLAMP